MYLYEWGFHWAKGQSNYEERMARAASRQRKPGQTLLENPDSVKESVSSSITDNYSLYAYNETYIDVRTPNDEKRGVITLFVGAIGLLLIAITLWSVLVVTADLLRGHDSDGTPLEWDAYVFGLPMPIIGITSLYLYFRYAFPYLRLEAFTARRLIVRFNRVTRKVYVLRPLNIGGTLIMDWDKTGIIVDKSMSEHDGTGGFIILGWDKGHGTTAQGQATEDVEMVLVGKPTRNASELLAFWEYIRRYMEDGPAAAPRPQRLISKFPWPWNSVKAAWALDGRFLRNSALWVFLVIYLMLLPAIVLHAIGHWISLLLCYEPRFPPAIEDAGQTANAASN